MDKAETALANAKREHDEKASEIEKEITAAQYRADAEEERWQKVKDHLEDDVRKTSRL